MHGWLANRPMELSAHKFICGSTKMGQPKNNGFNRLAKAHYSKMSLKRQTKMDVTRQLPTNKFVG
jgi:hypothetical protein